MEGNHTEMTRLFIKNVVLEKLNR